MSNTTEDKVEYAGVSLDIGTSTSKYLAFKVRKSTKGRPRTLFICRYHACGFYSNRSWNMADHHSRVHSDDHKSKSNTANAFLNTTDTDTLRSKLHSHLHRHKPKLEKQCNGYLTLSEDTIEPTPIQPEVIEELTQSLAKLNLSFDRDELPAVVQTRDLKVYEIVDGVASETNPTINGRCPHHLNGEKCQITKEGTSERTRCFDIESPFILNVPNFGCSVHKTRFTMLKCVTPNSYCFPTLIVLPHTVITRAFLNHIFNLAPSHYFNFSKLLTTIQTTWMSNFESRIQTVVALNVKSEVESRADISKINELAKTTANFIEDVYFLAHQEFSDTIKQQTAKLRRETGKVLRIDHTYKVVKNLSAFSKDDHTRVQIKASLFTVLNEKGQVLKTKIVPSDERKHVSAVLKKIWDTCDRSAVTTHVFTDNSVTDKNTIKSTWLNSTQKDNASPSVNQDLWHALHRIDQVMNHKHPDYHKARKQLSDILHEASEAGQLKTRLFSWCHTFEQLQSSSADSVIRKLASRFAISRASRKKKVLDASVM